jgi:hypothetical protein
VLRTKGIKSGIDFAASGARKLRHVVVVVVVVIARNEDPPKEKKGERKTEKTHTLE